MPNFAFTLDVLYSVISCDYKYTVSSNTFVNRYYEILADGFVSIDKKFNIRSPMQEHLPTKKRPLLPFC